jgi:hypothetical protein
MTGLDLALDWSLVAQQAAPAPGNTTSLVVIGSLLILVGSAVAGLRSSASGTRAEAKPSPLVSAGSIVAGTGTVLLLVGFLVYPFASRAGPAVPGQIAVLGCLAVVIPFVRRPARDIAAGAVVAFATLRASDPLSMLPFLFAPSPGPWLLYLVGSIVTAMGGALAFAAAREPEDVDGPVMGPRVVTGVVAAAVGALLVASTVFLTSSDGDGLGEGFRPVALGYAIALAALIVGAWRARRARTRWVLAVAAAALGAITMVQGGAAVSIAVLFEEPLPGIVVFLAGAALAFVGSVLVSLGPRSAEEEAAGGRPV